jgi:Mrp family chromosome partitioning ATPase/capsular polysaccharide biosynthesis protein
MAGIQVAVAATRGVVAVSTPADVSRPSPDEGLPVHLVRRAVRRYWALILAVGLIMSVAGAGFALSRPPRLTSSTEILLKPLVGNSFSPDSVSTPQQLTVGLETEANLVASPDVTELVSRSLHRRVSAGTTDVSASVVLNSQIIRISYSAASVTQAKAGVTAFAESFLQVRQEKAKAVRDNRVANLEKQEAALEKQVKAADTASSGSSSAVQTARLQALTSRLADLQDSLGSARAMSIDPGTVITQASTPKTVDKLMPFLLGAVVASMGFGAGLVIAVLRVWNDDRIDSSHDVFVHGVPIWAAMGDSVRGAATGLATADDPEVKEAYRRLRAAVIANARRGSVIAVTSASPLPGRAAISSNLAIALQDAGYDCALIDAEIVRPTVADLLGLSDQSGVADVVRGALDLDSAAIKSHGITVLTAGSNPEAVQERYSGKEFRSTLDALRARSDYVIMVGEDLSSGIGVTAAGMADSVLLTVVDRSTTQEEVAETLARSATASVQLRGIVTVSARSVKEAQTASRHGRRPADTPTADTPKHTEDAARGDASAKQLATEQVLVAPITRGDKRR